MILSQCASGLYQITATTVTGLWCLQSNQKMHRLGWCLSLTTQWEALTVTVQTLIEVLLNECFRILLMIFSFVKHVSDFCLGSLYKALLNLWLIYSNGKSEIYPNVGPFTKWIRGVTLLWGCYKTVQHEISTLFHYPRALPSLKFLPCCWGLWEMRVPLNQPSADRKWPALHFAFGSVWNQSSCGEPHGPDQTSSSRFSC